ADRIRQIRRLHGWSARELAEGCEAAGSASLTRSTIAKIESGVRKSVTADEIAVLALVLDVTPTDLIAPGEPAVARMPGQGVRQPGLSGLPVVPGGADGPTRRQKHAAAPNFWAALAPAQREAFRSVASWRAFPAGA